MRQITNPASGGRGARNTDLPGRLIDSESKPSPSEIQVAHIIARFRFSPPRAALVARLAFGEAVNA
jgi:hypothetical protein